MSKSKKSISEFLDDEYRNYAIYVVENRAIPSCIDGLKPSQRKIVFTANKIWKTGNEKPMKVFQLAGAVALNSFYHHGPASLDSNLVGMAQSFKNSMPLLNEIGQFGSLRSTEAPATRYISTSLSKNFRLLYKDFELLTSRFEEGNEIEPQYFLPIIPTVLLNGSSGIAVGFATNILNRNPKDLIEACLAVLENKKVKDLKPWNKYFSGVYEREDIEGRENSWLIKGFCEVLNTSTVEVKELPPSMTYEKYEGYLADLIEKGKISSYEDKSSNTPNYIIKFKREDLASLQKSDKLESLLKLHERETENLTTLDENGNLKIFQNVQDIVKYFVDFRLTYYLKRKNYLIQKIEKELKTLSQKALFIKYILENKITVQKVSKANIIEQLIKLKFETINDSFQYLLSMPIHSLSIDTYNELLEDVKIKKEELATIKAKDYKEMYKDDLLELKSSIK